MYSQLTRVVYALT